VAPIPLLLSGIVVVSLIVAFSDFRTRRIPNVVLGTALLYALAVLAIAGLERGPAFLPRALGYSFFGAFIGFLMLLPGYLGRQVAAGDVKFMMVIGFFMGPIGAAIVLLSGALFGGVWALVLAWRVGGLRKVFDNMRFMWRSLWLSGLREMGWDLGSQGAVRMPYGVALAAGVCAVAAWQIMRTPELRSAVGF